MAQTFRPLEGVRVVDLTTSLAGPTCTTILGSLGADVVKVEPPSGDEARHWGPPFEDGSGVLFQTANPSKRSLAISALGIVADPEPFPSMSRLGVDSNYLARTPAMHEAFMHLGCAIVCCLISRACGMASTLSP